MFLDVAAKVGLETFRVPLPVDWDFVRSELDGKYRPAFTNSDPFGTNNGGKHSIDVTYLAAAEATGKVRVAALHVVRDISMDPQKRWVLHVDRINTAGVVQEHKKIIADAVFLTSDHPARPGCWSRPRPKDSSPICPTPSAPSGAATVTGSTHGFR